MTEGYRKHAVIGDCGHRYRPPAQPGTASALGHTCNCGHPAPVWCARLDTWRCPLCAEGIRLDVTVRAVLAQAPEQSFRARPVKPDLFNRARRAS